MPPRLSEALNRNDDDPSDLAALVRNKVQYGHMPYIGVCGGATMASSPSTSAYRCGLDLLHGREILYASQTSTDQIGTILALTEK